MNVQNMNFKHRIPRSVTEHAHSFTYLIMLTPLWVPFEIGTCLSKRNEPSQSEINNRRSASVARFICMSMMRGGDGGGKRGGTVLAGTMAHLTCHDRTVFGRDRVT